MVRFMDRGFYNAASAMMLQQRKLDTISNNLANVRTAGYKSETVATQTFNNILISRLDEDGIYYDSTEIGPNAPLRIVDRVLQSYTQGDISTTDVPTDLALAGEGYFNIVNLDGETYYTRNGAFQLDEEGYLAFGNLGRVQGINGDIDLMGRTDFTITEEGIIFDYEGNEIDTLKISWVDDVNKLAKQDNGMFTAGEAEVFEIKCNVVQGALEGSSVDLNTQMTMVMEAQNRFQAMSTVLKTLDEINSLAVNQIGKL